MRFPDVRTLSRASGAAKNGLSLRAPGVNPGRGLLLRTLRWRTFST